MLKSEKLIKIIGHITFVIIFIFFSTLNAQNLSKFDSAENISDYFSGILLLNDGKYVESNRYLKKLNGLERSHFNYSSKYLFSLINSGKFLQAYTYSKKLEQIKQDSFESNLIIGIFYLKNSKAELANKYFLKAKKQNLRSILDKYIINSLHFWANLNDSNLDNEKINLEKLNNRFENLKKIQNVFLHCYLNSNKTDFLFNKLTSDENIDFSRYNYFYSNYLISVEQNIKAKKVIEKSLKKYPRNLLLNQYNFNLKSSKNILNFDCKDKSHVIAEILYIAANALSAQSIYPLSNFYLNLSQFLNEEFHAYDTLLAENFYKIDDFSSAKKIYKKMIGYGSAYAWYANKQIARILIYEDKKNESLKLLNKAFDSLPIKGIYETYDFAEYLKNNESFEESIKYYTKVYDKIDKEHPLYPDVMDGRGIAYERIDDWEKAERDLLNSLEVDPNQAYVINYLAYSWIEKGLNIEKALQMLEKANSLKSNDPYITDSLGWALYKLKRYDESKEYLQTAVRLMPADPIVNDHYGDVLWQKGKKIQARYYWKYVLNLEKTEKDLKKKIEKKLIKGL